MTRAPEFDALITGGAGRHAPAPRRRTLREWAGPLAVTLLAAVLRLWDLGTPRTLVFDETYYVKDAWTLLHLGYEGTWPEDADAAFNAGDVDGYSSDGSFVAHPPLGKWIIALGMQALGAENPVGWRLGTVAVGVLAVAALCLVARLLTGSAALATIAGGLLAVDGLAISMSRTALLDGSLMLLCLLGFTAVLLDRRASARRTDDWVRRRTAGGRPIDWGPALWARPWLVAAGALFGLATAVKWSGLYFLAAFAVYTLLVDAIARRRAGIRFWATSTALRQAPVSFVLTVPTAALAYLATWTGWFLTPGGYYRDWAEQQASLGSAATGQVASGIPLSLQSWWHYQVTMYNSNLGVTSEHGYQANPVGWLLLQRPTLFYYESGDGCGGTCVQSVTSMANPALWWVSVAAALYLVYRLARHREWRAGLVLTGIAAGYLPWLLYTDRTVFQFYTVVFLPYLVLALTLVIGLVLGPSDAPGWRRLEGVRVVAIVLGVIVAVSAFFYPSWTGLAIPEWLQRLYYWLPTWR